MSFRLNYHGWALEKVLRVDTAGHSINESESIDEHGPLVTFCIRIFGDQNIRVS